MPRVEFTDNLANQTAAPPASVVGATVRECLDAVFAKVPRLRGYVLDDQGALRQHVVIFLDGEAIRDRQHQGGQGNRNDQTQSGNRDRDQNR